MSRWAKILLAIIAVDTLITAIGVKTELLIEINPLMVPIITYSVLLFIAVKITWSYMFVGLMFYLKCTERIYRLTSMIYVSVLVVGFITSGIVMLAY